MTRILLALAAAGLLSACALPETTASNAATPYVEKETITGSRIPARHNAQGTKQIEMTPLEKDQMFNTKPTGLGGG
jgi:hypothetical protein